MKQEPTQEHNKENNIIFFPGADLPPESDYYIIRKIDEKEVPIMTTLASAVCILILSLFSFYGFIAFLSNN
tara:strand:+ start:34249 stop:34461 length:213 start_codon:yes stop_codon:yes gene_type:complete